MALRTRSSPRHGLAQRASCSSSIITRRTRRRPRGRPAFAPCAVLTIDGLGDGLSATISTFRDGRLERVAASPARYSLGVFFEHVTNLLNMRELEDEGKVMALADYAAPIADEDNPLLPLVRVRDGVIRDRAPGHALQARAGADPLAIPERAVRLSGAARRGARPASRSRATRCG